MPLNNLLLSSCLLPGKTSYTEKGVEINIKPSSGETILFFCIDNQSNPNCNLRQLLGLDREGMKICDLIVFYAKENIRIICFVELKGGHIKTATEQVITTYKYFLKFLKQCGTSLNFIPKVYIKSNSSAPQEIDKYKQQLKEQFGDGNYDISKNSDLGDFLRGVEYQPKGKRKKGK
ncbi:MAG: hypothetical protein RMX96_13790 [Nostoc sp. ChiSLP02]|nr:hypothetical protein [Nostoc sp. DedSLP05]MDZ8098913.1 hypothetical protein [Nostoc sp. DedSLP01]MDZ8185911.1 hypothetical protein [Nostoc sp. ChiSLP02]